jgi:hypothetical protein
MSYTLSLFRPLPGLDPLESYRRLSKGEPEHHPEEAAREFMERNPELEFSAAYREAQVGYGDLTELPQLAERLKARVPGFQEYRSDRCPWITLGHPEAKVIVTIRNPEIGIEMAYGGGDAPLIVAADCVDALAEVGFVAYDPQAERIVTREDFGIGRRETFIRRDRRGIPRWKIW